MEKNLRIGLFGGSFNPLHNGHIAIAEAAKREFGLHRVLFMVAKDPPHKQIAGQVSAALRLAMTEAGLCGREGLTASDLELRREGKSYTLLTLRELRHIYADAEIFCIVGADMLQDLPNWYHARELLRQNRFIGVGRLGIDAVPAAQAADLRAAYGAQVELCEFVGPAISSTQVREAVYEARPIQDWVPERIAAFIYENGLYLPEIFCALQEKVRRTLKEKRYIHTMGTVREAIELAARYGEDGKKARLAALLHDCAKEDISGQLERAAAYAMDLSDLARISGGILHGPLGAEMARREYGVTDTAVLDAIRSHTLCSANMTKLEKIIYLADKIEPGRHYAGVDAIRAAARRSLDAGVLACMDHSIAYIQQKGGTLHPGILEARANIVKNMKEA